MTLNPTVRGSTAARFAAKHSIARAASRFILTLIQAQHVSTYQRHGNHCVTDCKFQRSVALGQNAAVSLTLTRTCGGTSGTITRMSTVNPKTMVYADVGDVPLPVHLIRFLVYLRRDAWKQKHQMVNPMTTIPLHMLLILRMHLINILNIGSMATAKIAPQWIWTR